MRTVYSVGSTLSSDKVRGTTVPTAVLCSTAHRRAASQPRPSFDGRALVGTKETLPSLKLAVDREHMDCGAKQMMG